MIKEQAISQPLPEATVQWALFSFRGRISRASFILGQALMLSVLAIIVVMILKTPEDSIRFPLLGGAFIIAGAASAWGVLALSVKRLHDLGWSVGLIVFLFVPPVAMVSILILAAMPGSQETNQHGPPPFPLNR